MMMETVSLTPLTSSPAELRMALEAAVQALPMEGKGGEVRAIIGGSFADVVQLMEEEVGKKVIEKNGEVKKDGKGGGRKGRSSKSKPSIVQVRLDNIQTNFSLRFLLPHLAG